MTHDAAYDGSTVSGGDPYAATAGAYDLFIGRYRSDQVAALEVVGARLRPEAGPILDVGAGSGLNSEWVLDHLPDAELVALEPSRAMRSLLLARVAAHPEWFDRITVRPEDFFSAPLPPRIGGAILLGVIGHFDVSERAAVLAELAARLREGGAALIDLQAPETPARVEPFEFVAATVGQLNYRGIGEGWPIDDERMRWRMCYLTLEGERVLVEDTTEFTYHHPNPRTVAAEAAQVGLRLDRLGETTFWLLSYDHTDGHS
ncbi:class I SAM-dependent methyltransferase [Devriesea agamarum]|uniref:class I SAM-dependent methyltransferase n=1 Tax=Devriesea agamarum TaxID=472569 RepID=UPI00071DEFD4|nr:class I SAM-dependent methyltransferase [Devriesea agamarum]